MKVSKESFSAIALMEAEKMARRVAGAKAVLLSFSFTELVNESMMRPEQAKGKTTAYAEFFVVLDDQTRHGLISVELERFHPGPPGWLSGVCDRVFGKACCRFLSQCKTTTDTEFFYRQVDE